MRYRFSKAAKPLWITAFALLLLYVGTYVMLSSVGRYELKPPGTTSVEPYQWAPCGFTSDYYGTWNVVPVRVFYPLWVLDRRCWHKDENALSGVYPIKEPEP